MNRSDRGHRTPNRVAKRAAIEAVVIVAVGAVLWLRWPVPARDATASEVEASKPIGDEIVGRLLAFHDATGRYPASLEELERESGVAIPPPAVPSGRWEYRASESGFSLCFCEVSDSYVCDPSWCVYAASPGVWEYDDF